MNTEGDQYPRKTSEIEAAANKTCGLLEQKRTSSAPCSDCFNNRSMGLDQGTVSESQNASANKEVEHWLESTQSPIKGDESGLEDAEKEDGTYVNHVDNIAVDHSSQEISESVPEVDANADVYQQWLTQEEAKIRENAFQSAQRFCIQDIVGNPDLANAAKQELAPKQLPVPPHRSAITPQPSNVESVISIPESRASRLEHMLSVSENLDRDADKDMQAVTTELGHLLDRLRLGKTSCSDLMNLVQKLYRAETMYTAALLDCSRSLVSNIGHTRDFRDATESFVELPIKVRTAHTIVAETLVESISSLDNVLKNIKSLIAELERFPTSMRKDLKMKKIALTRSSFRHQVLCRRMERLAEEATAVNGATSDPWFTEGQVAHNYTQLIEGQANIRKSLSEAYSKVTEVEKLRLDTSKKVLSSLFTTYGSSISEAVKPFTDATNEALENVEVEFEVDDLKQSAVSSLQSEKSLRAHCSEEELSKCAEIFHSPDIIRQGVLQMLDKESYNWVPGHFVLTKSGLYWFLKQNDGSRPDEYVSLNKTDLQQVKAPLFKLAERGNSVFAASRTIVLKAGTVEDCFDWTADVRETIGSLKNQNQ